MFVRALRCSPNTDPPSASTFPHQCRICRWHDALKAAQVGVFVLRLCRQPLSAPALWPGGGVRAVGQGPGASPRRCCCACRGGCCAAAQQPLLPGPLLRLQLSRYALAARPGKLQHLPAQCGQPVWAAGQAFQIRAVTSGKGDAGTWLRAAPDEAGLQLKVQRGVSGQGGRVVDLRRRRGMQSECACARRDVPRVCSWGNCRAGQASAQRTIKAGLEGAGWRGVPAPAAGTCPVWLQCMHRHVKGVPLAEQRSFYVAATSLPLSATAAGLHLLTHPGRAAAPREEGGREGKARASFPVL